MKKGIIKSILLLAMTITLIANMTVIAFAAWGLPVSADLLVDTKSVTLHGYNVEGYDYYPLKDIAYILRDSDKAFNIVEEDGKISLVKNQSYNKNHTLFKGGDVIDGSASYVTQNFYIDDVRYTYSVSKVDGQIFMRLADITQLFDMCMVYNHVKDEIVIDTTKGYITNLNEIAKEGFFDFLHGAAVGDLQGEVYYSVNGNKSVAIASTTKVMTYLLVKEAIEQGEISWDDDVVITKEGARLSMTADNTLKNLTEGETIPLSELMDVMLVVSSNEAATMLGEHVAGTEEKFVELMNEKASELGLKTAKFYNAHGLPVYTQDILSSKLQNRMGAQDLLKLSVHVIDKFPEILDITNKQTVSVKSSDGYEYNGNTTNRLLFQIDGVDGLKTGTTNRAGACQIATMLSDPKNPKSDRFVAVVLGAEDNLERYWKTGMLLNYAKEVNSGRKPEVVYISIPKEDASVSGKIEILFTDPMDKSNLEITLNDKKLQDGNLSEDGKFFTASYSDLSNNTTNTISISGKEKALNVKMDKVSYDFKTVKSSTGNSSSTGSGKTNNNNQTTTNTNNNENANQAIEKLKDISSSDWYYDAVKFAVEKGLFTGVSDSQFAPNNNMTRSMFVTVLGRIAEQNGINIKGNNSVSFKDVVANTWYTDYVAWATANKIVSGYNETTFGVNDNITREQMAVILSNFAKYCNIKLEEGTVKTFGDSNKISDWALDSVNTVVAAGLINGYEDGSLRPQGNATRAEVAIILQGFMNNYIK